MNKILVLGAAALTMVACGKDNFETKPRITSVDTNDNTLNIQENFVADLGFTDKEGDLQTVTIFRNRVNRRGPASFDIPFSIPETNNEPKGSVQVVLEVRDELLFNLSEIRIPGTSPAQYEPATLDLRFLLKDREGNTSDTTEVHRVIINR